MRLSQSTVNTAALYGNLGVTYSTREVSHTLRLSQSTVNTAALYGILGVTYSTRGVSHLEVEPVTARQPRPPRQEPLQRPHLPVKKKNARCNTPHLLRSHARSITSQEHHISGASPARETPHDVTRSTCSGPAPSSSAVPPAAGHRRRRPARWLCDAPDA